MPPVFASVREDLNRSDPVRVQSPDEPTPFWDALTRSVAANAEDGVRNRVAGWREQEWRGVLIERHREIERLTGERLTPSAEQLGYELPPEGAEGGWAGFVRGLRDMEGRGPAALYGLPSIADYEARIEALRATHDLSGILSRDDLWARQNAALNAVRARADETMSDGVAGAVGGFAGQVAGSFADPVNVAASLATGGVTGAGRPLLQRMAVVGAVNMGIETAQVPGRAADAGNFGGPDYTAGEAVTEVIGAGAFGGVFEAGRTATVLGWRQLARMRQAGEADAGTRGTAQALDRLLADEAAIGPAPDFDAARTAMARGDLPPQVQPEQGLDELFAGAAATRGNPSQRDLTILPGAAADDGLVSVDYRGRRIWSGRFDPLATETDAATFQYKADGDAAGVTNRLRGVEQWDATAAGRVLLFENREGRTFVADGHQRRGLAVRLSEQGFDDARLDGYLFREADGWSPREVRVVAALKNMREGSGTILDAAKVFRDAPGALRDRSLPVSGEFITQARQLASLSEPAFRAVVNGVIPERYAAVIGELAAERPELHADLVALLKKASPGSTDGARALTHEAMLDDFIATEGVQTDLFGGLPRQSTLIARGQIREAVMAGLRKDQRTFGGLVRNADAIEAGGNVLSRSDNEARLAIDRAAQELVSKLSLRAGDIGEAFADAAAAVTKGDATVAGVSRGLIQRIRTAVKKGELAELQRKAVLDPDPPSMAAREAAKAFDDPAGPGQRAQLEPKPEDAEIEAGRAGLFDDLPETVAEERALNVLRACAPGKGG
ncbi:MAG: hypothetical protein ACK4FB_09035 [Brevundimonas sp.]|uniref:hypothetical protein n=1 Tax=Brevundimonas sp. TaxID=1871086 RepID=UPI0039199514